MHLQSPQAHSLLSVLILELIKQAGYLHLPLLESSTARSTPLHSSSLKLAGLRWAIVKHALHVSARRFCFCFLSHEGVQISAVNSPVCPLFPLFCCGREDKEPGWTGWDAAGFESLTDSCAYNTDGQNATDIHKDTAGAQYLENKQLYEGFGGLKV